MAHALSMICIYRVRRGREDEFKALLAKHWPTLDRAGLVSGQRARVYHGASKDDSTSAFIEMFEWKDREAPDIAHQTPEVMAVWEPMGALTEDMEFLQVQPVSL
jgi:hypothetical protein